MSSSPRVKRKPDPIDAEVGRRIRARRVSMEMSQTDLGQALGVTYQQVQKYEAGRSKVGAGRLQSIANVLEVPLSYFFEIPSARDDSGNARLSAGRSLADFVSSPMGRALNRGFARINDSEVRRAYLGLVTRIAEREGNRKQDAGE
ncbi:transcriptional regulator with XRE-family HTH domain [Sinorhizobium fredii]|nr:MULTISPECIES: helix-turn-helix transcriptional regulator [Sinorhizobium]